MNESQFTPIAGTTEDGSRVWYTGRAGKLFVSPERAEAFLGYSLEGARAAAQRMNRFKSEHGIHFVAVTGDLADWANGWPA